MELGKLFVTIAADTKKLTAGLAKAKGEVAKTTAGMGAQFKTMGMGMAVAGAAVTAAFGLTIRSAMSFEAELAQVSTMLDDTTMKHMPQYASGLQKLAMEFGESTKTLSKGLYDILSASIEPAKALDVLAVASKAATAGITDTGVAADAITTIINSYGLEAEDAGKVSDQLFAIVKRGKCLTGETRILLSDGRYKRIDSLKNEKDLEIISWDYRNFVTTKAKFVDMGTKRIVKIITADGREIRTTPEHPYLTPNGWEKVENLKGGNKIAVPSSLPFFGRIKPKDGWPELLGYLLAEGSIQNSSPRLAIDNPIILDKVKDAAKRYGINVKKINQKDKTKCGAYMLTAGIRDSKHKNPVIDKLREYDLWGKNCHTKFIPEEVFSWKKEDIAKLLNAYFNGDGWLSKKTVSFYQIGVCSVSEQLVRDVSHLLLRFGVNGYIRKTSANAWMWEAKRYIEIKRFIDFIGIERESVKEFLRYIPQKRGSYKYLTSYGKTPGEKIKHKPYGGIINTDNQLYYIKIKKIIYQDEERVYDLIVPKLHNFVANDILAHNTTFAELAPAIGTVAATAHMSGLSFEDLGASISTVTRAGINTNAAMTSINGVLKAFLKPQEKAVEMAKKFGLELNTTTLKTIGLTGVMEKLKDATAEELAAIFGSIRGLKGMAAALGDAEGYAKDYKSMLESTGLTQTAFEKQANTMGFQLNRLKQSFVTISQDIGDKFAPILRATIDVLLKVTGAMKKWMDAHPKLIKAITLLGATLGVLAGAGGLFILLVSSLIKIKSTIDTVTFALKLLNVRIGATGALTTGTLIPALAKLKVSLGLLGTIATGPIGLLILAVGGLYLAWEKNLFGMKDITTKIFDDIKERFSDLKEGVKRFVDVTDTLGGGGGGIGAFGDDIDDLAGSMGGFGEETEKAGEKLDEFGNKIETFDEWVERLNEEAKTLAEATEGVRDKILELSSPMEYQIKLLEEEAEALREMGIEESLVVEWLEKAKIKLNENSEATRKLSEAKKKLADMTKSLTDKIYEFTHTEEEVKLRDINREYDLLIENAKEVFKTQRKLQEAITAINDKRQEEIDKLKELHPEKEKDIKDTDDLADSYKKLKKPIEEAGEAAKNVGVLGGKGWDEFTASINRARISLSNFTKEGLAAMIATIKMKFFPVLQDLYKSLETAGYYTSIVQGQINNVLAMQAEQVATATFGLEAYNEALANIGGTANTVAGAISNIGWGGVESPAISDNWASFQHGTPYVPKTGLAVVHRGEEINPPGQRSYDQRKYSPTININNPIVRNDNDIYEIKKVVEQALEESNRQYDRRGYELVPGMG